MLTKGFITSLPEYGDNIYKVRLPIFEQAGITKNKVTTSEFNATLSHDPGTLNAYKEGDCVYVAFEDNNYSNPVIIGLLDVNDKREATTFSLLNSLKVTEAVELPLDTSIGGTNFKDLVLQLNQLQAKEDRLPTPIANNYLHVKEDGNLEWAPASGTGTGNVDSVSINGGTPFGPDANKNVDLVIETNDLIASEEGSTYIDLVGQRSPDWGQIEGNITDQTDLINYISSQVPTSTSQLTNDSGFITNLVNDLVNYYTKNETYTKEQVDELIAEAASLKLKKVDSIEDVNEPGYIYLVPVYESGYESGDPNDYYDEYIYDEDTGRAERIGSTRIDWDNYYTKSEVDSFFVHINLGTDTSGVLSQTDLDAIAEGRYIILSQGPTSSHHIYQLSEVQNGIKADRSRYRYWIFKSWDFNEVIESGSVKLESSYIIVRVLGGTVPGEWELLTETELELSLLAKTGELSDAVVPEEGSQFIDLIGQRDPDWGNIQGDITNQTDLIEYIDTHGGSIKSITINDTTYSPESGSTNVDLGDYVTESGMEDYVESYHDNTKVDKETGKGLSTNDYTTAEKNKLAGIESGAQVNVQADWNETESGSDAYIKNKPTIPVNTNQKVTALKNGSPANFGDNATVQFIGDGDVTVIPNVNNNQITVSGHNQTIKAKYRSLDMTFDPSAAVELVAGNNIGIVPDNQANTITINASQPAVNDGTLNIKKNGTTVASFTANQSSTTNANITFETNELIVSEEGSSFIDLVGSRNPDWGNIEGDIEDQADLIEYIDENAGKVDSIQIGESGTPIYPASGSKTLVIPEYPADTSSRVTTLESYVSSGTTSSNQLVNESTMNSAIAASAANLVTSNAAGDSFATKAALTGASTYYSGGQVYTPQKNDYAIVSADESHSNNQARYKCTNATGPVWSFEYVIGSTQVNADWNASSGVAEILNKPTVGNATITIHQDGVVTDQTFDLDDTTNKTINLINTNTTYTLEAGSTANIVKLTPSTGSASTVTVNNVAHATNADSATSATNASKLNNQEASYYLNYNNLTNTPTLATVATSGSYNDLSNKPTIGTGILTIQKNGTNLQTFGANSTDNKTANITFETNELIVSEAGSQFIDLVGNTGGESGEPTDVQINGSSITASGVANILTQGVYNSSTNKIATMSDLPAEVTESTVSGWGFTKNTGTVTSVDSTSPSNGNVELNAVKYTSQSLSDNQKSQARSNIGAGTSNFTGYTASDKLSTDYIQNDAGWTNNQGTVTSVNNTAPVNGNVTITIPAEVTETTVTNWGFTKNQGTVKSVNNTQPDASGNVTLTIPQGDNQTIKVKVNGSDVVFGANDVVELKAGNNVSIIPDTGNKTITIASTAAPGSSTDVQINGTSIVSGNAANILTQGTYNESSNKIATMSDLPPTITISTGNTKSVSDGTNTLTFGSNAFNSTTIPTTYIKSTSSSGNTLTITKQDNTTTTFTPTFTEQHVGDVVTVTATSGSGISISGTTANPTIGISSSYKLPTSTEWASKQDNVQILDLR